MILGDLSRKDGLNPQETPMKAQNVLDKLGESETKSEKLISEEFDKIKHLMDYSKKTQ